MNVAVRAGCVVVALAGLSVSVAMADDAAVQKPDPGQRAAEHFKAMDTDGNGTISLAEFTAAQEKRTAELKAKLGDKWDAEKAAKMPSAEEKFKKTDTNGDGALTLEEMNAAHQKHREAMGQHKGEGAHHHKGQAGDKPAEGQAPKN